MKTDKVVDIVRELALASAAEANVELVDVEYVKEGGGWFLRVYIDKPEGIGLEDCQAVSERLSDKLDVADPIPNQYRLEVSSPGLNRPLKTEGDYARFNGETVEVHTFKPVGDRKRFVGRLLDYREGKLSLGLDEGKTVEIQRENIAKANLHVDI